ncbi:hypothetical protein HZC30_00090 [Candidatus Woesearchaeota archaeon]|nr:hypothetical protein [Candidatus Woesearchaeota archaeon]
MFSKKGFIEHPLSAVFIALIIGLILGMVLMYLIQSCIIQLPFNLMGCSLY